MGGGVSTSVDAPAVSRFLGSGDESGTPPGDRPFRPDVEGLRALAVALVVLYHASVPGLTGGYVGVDVFFVISGFVITGLLLRERQRTGTTSFVNFYARRCRRILPAACFVILLTAGATYLFVGYIEGNFTADDGRWAAVFLSNFHFQALGTAYLSASRPPSPLLNYWSLSVEEQFYLAYPALFALVAAVGARVALRVRLAWALAAVVVASFFFSVIETATNPNSAYFSPFTRAWELALGGLVAVATPALKRIPVKVAALLTWAGLAAIVVSAFVFGAHTAYPGSLVAVPVVGAAVVIGAGVVVPRYGTESILGLAPSRWLGKRSYSLYLVHWPILVIVVYAADRSELPVGERLGLVAVSVLVAMGMFRLVENPIRHWRLPARASVLGGGALVVGTLLILTVVIQVNQHGPYDPPVTPAATSAVVERQVTAAAAITHLPTNLEAPISQAASDLGGAFMPYSCGAGPGSSAQICPEGDPKSNRRMVVYGDSHAQMWFPAFEAIAKAAQLKLIVLAKDYCPAEPLPIAENPNVSKSGQVDSACTAWHTWASKTIHRLKPALLVVTQEALYSPPGNRNQGLYSSAAWQRGLEAMFDSLAMPGTKEVLLGNTPVMGHQGPTCLEAHPDDVQACSTPARTAVLATNRVEQATAAQHGVAYIDPTPWFCSSVCPAVIGHYSVYIDGFHISATYARYLEQVLGDALGFRLGSIGS